MRYGSRWRRCKKETAKWKKRLLAQLPKCGELLEDVSTGSFFLYKPFKWIKIHEDNESIV